MNIEFARHLNKNNIKYLLIAIVSFTISNTAIAHGLKYHEFRPVDHRVGLDASAIYAIMQDRQGLIWLGTDRGLYSYDGYQARHYSPQFSINENFTGVVYSIQLIDSIHIWLGTDNGLFVFNTYTDRFETTPKGLPQNIRAIARINDHSFWIGSINGLYRYDNNTRTSERIADELLPHQAIYTILRYDDNTFLFGTYNGLCKFDNQTGQFERVPLANIYLSPNQLVLSLLADYKRNCIWVGVEGGLFSYNPHTNRTEAMQPFKGNSVKALMFDNQNCLLAGTDNGLFIYDPVTTNYRIIRHDALNDRSLINNVVWSVFIDREQNIWLGTDAGVSLYVFNKQFRLQSISEITGSNEGNQIISILTDSKNNLWLGGTNGLIKINRLTGKSIWYQQNNPQFTIPHNKVRHIFEDADGDIWIATDGSVCRYNEQTNQFDRYQIEDATHTRNANWAYDICQDETNKLWIATCLGGLFVVDKQQLLASKGKPFVAERNYYIDEGKMALSGNMLQFLTIDKEKNIWAGTYRAGLNKIDRFNQKVEQFTVNNTSHPLSSDEVTALLADDENNLWIALRNEIDRFDLTKNKISRITDVRLTDYYINSLANDGKHIWFSVSQGLFYIDKSNQKIRQVNAGGYYYLSVYFDRFSQQVIAGGINEYLEFNPEVVLNNEVQNSLYVTALWVNDKLVQDSTSLTLPSRLNQSIRFTDHIKLPHRSDNIALTFSELKYNQQQDVQYAYKMSPVDADWRLLSGGSNRISYNNLQPGDYTLMISRIGSDGNPLSNPRTLSIIVMHPWYLTWWAKVVYYLLITLVIFAIVNYFLILNRLRYERLEKNKTMELTAHKIDFLTNISHELKTPLSMIIGPLSKMIDLVKTSEVKDQLSDVRQNALKMSSLIHQMMEASRQEVDGFGLIVTKTDLVVFVQSIVSVFDKPLRDKQITISLESNVTSLLMDADVLKLEVILNNILSNAAKFAPENSQILVKIEGTENQVLMAVTDQGPGIDAHDLPHVFERFYQSHRSLPQNKEGSGIGLSIVKEYVQMHNGSVKAVTDGKSGTTIEIVLPVQQASVDTAQPFAKATKPIFKENSKKPVVLVVEDNLEILNFIANNLANQYKCITAQNGKIGFEMALVEQPDIIITDVMMPVMDGLEMCRRLKENITTSLIPVIVLTAKDDRDTELKGYQIGIDVFIAKPFEISYLSERIRNLLKGRNLLVQKARQEAIIQPKEEEIVSPDEKFLTIITQIIEAEMANPDLNVNVLSERSGYSAKQVYRRIKSLTGQTAVDYIRSVRLKKAAMLLSGKTFTVAEVMYMVGFSNHSYFAKRFQEMFGKSPKQFAEDGLKGL